LKGAEGALPPAPAIAAIAAANGTSIRDSCSRAGRRDAVAATPAIATIGCRIAARQTYTALPTIPTAHRDTGFNRDSRLTRTADTVSAAAAIATASATCCECVIGCRRKRNRAGTFDLTLIVFADHDAAIVVFIRVHARYATGPTGTACATQNATPAADSQVVSRGYADAATPTTSSSAAAATLPRRNGEDVPYGNAVATLSASTAIAACTSDDHLVGQRRHRTGEDCAGPAATASAAATTGSAIAGCKCTLPLFPDIARFATVAIKTAYQRNIGRYIPCITDDAADTCRTAMRASCAFTTGATASCRSVVAVVIPTCGTACSTSAATAA
jgi:hypothetical protein